MCVSVVDVLVRDRRAVEIQVFAGVEAFGVVVVNRWAGDGPAMGRANQTRANADMSRAMNDSGATGLDAASGGGVDAQGMKLGKGGIIGTRLFDGRQT